MELITGSLRRFDDLFDVALNIPYSDIQLSHYHSQILHGSSYALSGMQDAVLGRVGGVATWWGFGLQGEAHGGHLL
ncbi:hypothetical protein D3C76_832700 [compost metagenome]